MTTPTTTSAPPTLFGRDRQWQALMQRCQQVRQSQGGTLWLSGEAGIGKTVLMQQLRTWAEANGFQTLWGRHLNHAQAPPLHGLREALAQLFGLSLNDPPEVFALKINTALEARWPALQLHRRTLTELLQPPDHTAAPTLPRSKEEQAKEVDRSPLYYLIFRLLSLAAQEKPLLVLLDDLHWADVLTLDILAYLSPFLADQPILLLGAYRPEEPDTFWKKLEGLTLEPSAEHWSLPRLGLGEVEEMAATYDLGSERQFCQQLFQVTEGVPLFVQQFLLSCQSEGDLSPDLALSRTPTRITQVIQRRLHRLCAEDLQVLRIASVIGEKFSAALVAQIHHQPLDLVLEALARLEEEHLLIQPVALPNAEALLSFHHVLIRQALYESMPTALRQQLHQQAAEVLAPLFKTQPERVFEVAHHFLAGQQREGATEVLLQAGRRALGLKAYAEAREYFQQAEEAAGTETQRAIAAELLGDTLWELGRWEDAPVRWEQSLRLQILPLRRAMLYWKLTRVSANHQQQWHCLQSALQETNLYPHSVERAQILLTTMALPAYGGESRNQRRERATKQAAEALRILRHHPNHPLFCQALVSLTGFRDPRITNLGRARRLLRRAIRLAEQHEDWGQALVAHQYLAELHRGIDLDLAISEGEKSLRLAEGYYPPHHQLLSCHLSNLLTWNLARGDQERVDIYASRLLPMKYGAGAVKQFFWRQYPEEIWDGHTQGLRDLCALDAREHTLAVSAGAELSRLQRLSVETGREAQYRDFIAEVLRDHPDCFLHLGLVQWELTEAQPPAASTGDLAQQHGTADLQWRDETENSHYTLLPGEGIEITPGPEVGLGWLNSAPCLLALVPGDFVLETRITPDAHPQHAGGIVVWQDHSRLIRFASGIDHQGQISLGWHDGGQFRFVGLAYLRHWELHLKLIRRGIRFHAFFSPDGQHWYTFGYLDFGHAGPVEVGLFAECNYEYGFPQPFPIRFAGFNLCAASPIKTTPAARRTQPRLFPLPEPAQFCGMVGQGRAFRTFCEKLQRAARSSLPLLIGGETGTGKELAVQALHELSANSEGPLVPVNLAALPADLVESELFGYTREPSPVPPPTEPASLRRLREAPSFWTKSANCPSAPRPSCCAPWTAARSAPLGLPAPNRCPCAV